MDTEIWVAIITLGGVVYASTVGIFVQQFRKSAERHQKNVIEAADTARARVIDEARRSFHQQVTSPYYPVKDWTSFVIKVKKVCRDANTGIDRVLILVAVNGTEAPTHASVVWEYRHTGESFSYVDVPLDLDYQNRLMRIKDGSLLTFTTESAANTMIGKFYKEEGVTQSVWVMIGQRINHETGQVALKYMSFATHREGGFQSQENAHRLVNNLAGDFRSMIYVSGFGPI